MTKHLHAKYVPGCYRCELGRDEDRWPHIETCQMCAALAESRKP